MRGFRLDVDWVEKADVFLADAKRHLSEGHFWLTCFESHQAAELYLKSLLVSLTGLYPYTHDLSELLESLKSIGLDFDDDVAGAADHLTPHYTLFRYPGRRAVRYTFDRAERCLRNAVKIVEWVRRIADP